MQMQDLLSRIIVNPEIFGGRPIISGWRIAVENILGMLASGNAAEEIIQFYPFIENEDIQAWLVYVRRLFGRVRVEPALLDGAA